MSPAQVLAERVILMHQGGWDEILLVVGPLVVIAVLVIVARKQAPVEDGESDTEADE